MAESGRTESSTPAAATVEPAHTLTDTLWRHARERPDQLQFLRRDPGAGDGRARWEEISCGRFQAEVVRLARGLIAAGIQPGDRIALMCRTRYEWSLIDYAVLACGAVTVPIYPNAGAEQAGWALTDSGAVACVVESADQRDLILRHRDGGATDRFLTWVIEDGELDRLDGVRADGSVVEPAEVDERRAALRADDPASIIYTSGTTGRPKGCLLTHRNLLTDVLNAVPALAPLFAGSGARTVLFLPLAHAFARLVQFGCVEVGATLAPVPDPDRLPTDLTEVRPTFLLAIPRVLEKVYDNARAQAGDGMKGALFRRAETVAVRYSERRAVGRRPGPGLTLAHRLFDRLLYRKLRQRLGDRCRHVISGGAPLGSRLAHFFRGVGIEVYEGYGLTETSPAVTVNTPEATRIGTVGRPLPGVSVSLADDGEVLVGGDIVFPGYWRNEAATAEVRDATGRFRTGDLGRLDEAGFLTITGRKKEMIITAGGKNVAPAGLEDRLRAHPLIAHGIVIGDQRPFIAALVTIDEQAWPRWLAANDKPTSETVEALREDPDLVAEVQRAVDDANRIVSRAEAIREFRILPAGLSQERGELTPTLKVKRGVVDKEYADEIDAIYRG